VRKPCPGVFIDPQNEWEKMGLITEFELIDTFNYAPPGEKKPISGSIGLSDIMLTVI